MRRILLSLLAVFCALTLLPQAMAEVAFLPECADWALDAMPLELTLSADVTAYAPFDKDRLPQLTSLLKHLALRIAWQPLIDETQSAVSVLVDGEEALSLGLQRTESATLAQLSVLPTVTYAGADPLSALLGTSSEAIDLFGIDGTEYAWIEEGYVLLNALESVLAPYLTSESSVKTDISGMGAARLKQDYTVSKDDAPGLAELLSGACPEGRLKALISGLTFSGKQTLRVYRTAEGVPLRMEWNGNCGMDEAHLREANLVWRLRRDDTAYRDEISLKSPALRGTDRNTLEWSCNVEPNKKGQRTLEGKLSYSWTADKQKTTLTGSYKLTATPSDDGTRVTGEASITRQLPDEDTASGYSFAPDLVFSGDANMPAVDGTLTVTGLYGKKTTDQAVIALSLRRTGYTSWHMREETVDLARLDDASLEALRQQVARAASSALIRRLVLLPREDLDYLFLDLPDESVQAILNAAQSQ